MGNGQYEELVLVFVLLDAVDDTVGEAYDQEPTNLTENVPSGSWMDLETVDGMLDCIQEDSTEPLRLIIVESRCLEELLSGEWMPRNRTHFRRDRACSRTTSDGMASTAPSLSSR